MLYFALFCVIFVISQPHLRFIVKTLPKVLLILTALIVVLGIAVIGVAIFNQPNTVLALLFSQNFEIGHFFGNIASSLKPVFSWYHTTESVFLSPLISLPIYALALVGLFSSTKGFFASRNSIATILLIFCLIIAGFNPDSIVFIILPFSILIAHGLKYLLEKWYNLFPENPYARISAIIPLTILFAIMIIPNLLQYIYGYRYNPTVANQFNYSLPVVRNTLTDEKLVVKDNYDFYKILEDSTNLTVVQDFDESSRIAVLGEQTNIPESYQLQRIITTPMRENSDIIYVYEKKGE